MANKLIEDTKVQIEMLRCGDYTFSPSDTADILQKLVDELQKCEQCNVRGALPFADLLIWYSTADVPYGLTIDEVLARYGNDR